MARNIDNSKHYVTYTKSLVDNVICNRRFHLVYEEGAPEVPHVQIKCPHCNAVILDEYNHPMVMLSRDENLVKSPDGTEPLMTECYFAEKIN